MKKPFRNAFIALSINAAFLLAAFIALFCVRAFTSSNVLGVLIAPFTNFKPVQQIISNGISYGLAIGAIVVLVLGITMIKKKAVVKAVVVILAIVGIVASVYSMSATYLKDATTLTSVVLFFANIKILTADPVLLPRFILLLCQYCVFAFFYLCLIATLVIGIKYSKVCLEEKLAAQKALEEEEEAKMNEYIAASMPIVEETPVMENSYDSVDSEPVPMFTPEPEPEMEPEPVKEEPKEEPLTASSLAAMLKDVVREIVKDELAKQKVDRPENDNHSVVGATFGGPLVVQYFNGGINGVTPAEPVSVPAPAQKPVEEPKEEPAEEPKEEVAEETVVEEPAPVEEVATEEVVEEAPVEEPAPVEEVKEEETPIEEAPVEEIAPVEEYIEEEVKEEPIVAEAAKAPIIRIPFEERMVNADSEIQNNYNEIKNEIMSYGVHSRVSSGGDSFRLHRKTFVKMTIAGKSLKLYFALDPKDYEDSKMPIGDASHKAIYAETPFVFKVKSGLSMRRCKQLIADVMTKNDLEQGEVESINWVKEIRATLRERAKEEKAQKEAEVEANDVGEDSEEE